MFKFIYKTGQQLRNPSLVKWFQFLKKSEKWSLETLEQYQLEKLKEITLYAYQNCPFYKKYFDLNQFHPNQIESLTDVKKIPLITKKQLLNNVSAIHSTQHFNRTYKATTSGSSGNSLQFKRDESADSFNRAAKLRGFSWYGVNPWDYNGYFWGFNFSTIELVKTKLLDFLQHRFRLFNYKSSEFNSFLRKLQKATYISGYSSMIYESAKLINRNKLPKPSQLKMVLGTSEKILEVYKGEVEQAFGLKLTSEYGATETGIIAFECMEGNMHITMEGVLVEAVDNEIVVTNLQMKSFPVIRYKLGDYIKLSTGKNICKCGMAHPVIEEVTGRIGETIYGFEHQYPSLYCYYIFKNLSKKHSLNLNYEVVQKEKGTLLFYIEQDFSEKEQHLINSEVKKYFKNDMKVYFYKKEPRSNGNAKAVSFKSFIQ